MLDGDLTGCSWVESLAARVSQLFYIYKYMNNEQVGQYVFELFKS
jgi:hypothetical protein